MGMNIFFAQLMPAFLHSPKLLLLRQRLKHDAIATYKDVSTQLLNISKSARRVSKDIDSYTDKRKKVQEKFDQVKEEKDAKQHKYVKGEEIL
jgi:predicted  nucleic acid-binding Zn-ribbon protein